MLLKANASDKNMRGPLFAKTTMLATILLALAVESAAYASEFGTQLFSGLYPLLGQLADQNRPADPALAKSIARANEAFSRVESEMNARALAPPEAVKTAIQSYREQLNIALADQDPRDAAKLMNDVAHDAELKWKYMTSTSGFTPFDRPMLVTVSVMTFRGARSEPGYSVTCNPFRDADRKTALFPFASDTNHASLPLPPGRYRIQLYKGNKLILGRDILVGQTPKQTEEVKIDVSNY